VATADRIKTLMEENLQWGGSWSDVDASYPLLEKQVVDSLGMITLISLLEEEFDVDIEDTDVVPANFRTIQDIAELVDSKL
jgi:acyl carrier protein